MNEERINEIATAVKTLTDKFTEFIAIESARQERDKHQIEINERILQHIEKVDNEYKPTIMRSKKYHGWIDDLIGKKIIPIATGLMFAAMLSAAGYALIK